MPWSNQGGPWGGGQGPWGRGSGGQPPNLEDLLRQGQDRFKRFVPKGAGGPRAILYILVGGLLLWLASGIYRVQPDEQGIVMRFGGWIATTDPGLHYHLPTPIEWVITPKVERINSIDIGFRALGETGRGPKRDVPEESLMLTGDQNIIDIDVSVLWKVSDAGKFLFNIREPELTVKTAAESALREIIGRIDIQPALTEARRAIESDTRVLLQSILDTYGSGIEITQVQLQEVHPPTAVTDAFNDVQRALQDRDRLQNEA
ncbi:MAG: FtsH protease activity modulator HflK, partial [Alphaproteobacteria bacterium]